MKRIVLILTFVLLCFKGYCKEDKHLIVSIDLKSEITMYDREYAVSKIKSVIPRMLRNNNITEGYASIQFFSVNENASNLEEYVKNINDPFQCPSCGSKKIKKKKVVFWVDKKGNYID